MLPRHHNLIENGHLPRICKTVGGEDASRRGAFARGTELIFSVYAPRRLGVTAVTLRIARDGEAAADLPFAFVDSARGVDEYRLTLTLDKAFCRGEDALFYYEILFSRGAETLYTDSVNNMDFTLSAQSAGRFRLLVYRADFQVPEWFAGGTMYHIFVDRFRRGVPERAPRADARLNPDWEKGIPDYPERAGDAFDNNTFFGGDLEGVREKLDYLSSLGVTVIYLCPIFKSHSNHKYDTGDYEQVDEMFGGEEALRDLIRAAKEKGIRLILDGVFNHTGDDSRYFNRYGNYDSLGAYQSPDSPYFDWYRFDKHPDRYDAWWGIDILPKLNHGCEACRQFFVGEGGIVQRYLQMGIGGWRLDVADELSDEFLDELRSRAKQTSRDALIIGEVWENAADKIAYGKRRRYFRGTQLDSVMNYPLKDAILAFVLHGDASCLYNTVTELYSSYPPLVCDALMNLLGTHDTARILSVLGGAPLEKMENRELARFRLSVEQRRMAIARLKVASTLQFTLPGVPSVYYGDEAGLEGGRDPFCRMPYPWGREEEDLVEHYRFLGGLRAKHSVFRHGALCFWEYREHLVAYTRESKDERLLILANSGERAEALSLPSAWTDVATGERMCGSVSLEPMSARVLSEQAFL